MAPAVEIDPRLLRQLEEEYETLKNDTERESGAGGRLDVEVSMFFSSTRCTCRGKGACRVVV
jgi:hypothetical protein